MKTNTLLIVTFFVVCIIGVLVSWLMVASTIRYINSVSVTETFIESLLFLTNNTNFSLFATSLAISLLFSYTDLFDWFDDLTEIILKNK